MIDSYEAKAAKIVTYGLIAIVIAGLVIWRLA